MSFARGMENAADTTHKRSEARTYLMDAKTRGSNCWFELITFARDERGKDFLPEM